MAGTKSLRKLLLAKEVTAGTEVHVATALLRMEGVPEDRSDIVFPPEDIGRIMGANRSYKPFLLGGVPLPDTPATFEQLGYLLNMAFGFATGVQDGAGSDYIYTYNLPNTSWTVPQTYSVQGGDDQQVEFGTYCFAESLKLSGKPKEALMMSAGLTCRNAAPNSLTAITIAFNTTAEHITDSGNGLGIFAVGDKIKITGAGEAGNNQTVTVATVVSAGDITVSENVTTEAAGASITLAEVHSAPAIPTVEEILFNKGTLAIDAVGGTIGATVKSDTFIGMALNIAKCGHTPRFSGDGNLYYSGLRHVVPEVLLDITFEHDGSATTEKAAWKAQTPRKIRLKFQGNSVATAGTTYSVKTLIADLAGKWSKFSVLGEEDGNDIVTGTFRVSYDSTANLLGQILLVNELSALP